MNFDPVTREIHQAYNSAEQSIKLIEREFGDSGIAVPAINELRYAGQHLCRALVESDDVVKEKHYRDALGHCRRASYDAHELRLVNYFSKCVRFQSIYSRVVISSVLPSYLEDRAILNTINQTTLARDHENREQFFRDIEKDSETIRNLLERWENARPQLNLIVENDRRDNRRYIVGLSLTICGIIVTAIVGVLALFR